MREYLQSLGLAWGIRIGFQKLDFPLLLQEPGVGWPCSARRALGQGLWGVLACDPPLSLLTPATPLRLLSSPPSGGSDSWWMLTCE